MNATAIIEEIKQLPPVERREVVRYVRDMEEVEEGRPWSPEKLEEYAEKMVAATDPVEAEKLEEQLIAGFYGDEPHA